MFYILKHSCCCGGGGCCCGGGFCLCWFELFEGVVCYNYKYNFCYHWEHHNHTKTYFWRSIRSVCHFWWRCSLISIIWPPTSIRIRCRWCWLKYNLVPRPRIFHNFTTIWVFWSTFYFKCIKMNNPHTNDFYLNRSIISSNNFNNSWSINNFCVPLTLLDYSNNPSLMTFLFSQFCTKFCSLKIARQKTSWRPHDFPWHGKSCSVTCVDKLPVHVVERWVIHQIFLVHFLA